MPGADTASVLARTAGLAERRRIPEVGAFVTALPAAADRAILLLVADGTDARPLHDWIAGLDPGAGVRTAGLEEAGTDATATLAANRIVVALQCGRLLQPDTVEAAAAIVSRPPGSFVVALVGAEILRTNEDLELVRRGIWRVLLGEPGVEWVGQDLAPHGCLLWDAGVITRTAADAAVAEAITRDTGLLRQWMLAEGPPAAGLAPLRAAHAVDLLERGLARQAQAPGPVRRSPQHTAHELRDAAAALRARVTRRFDADVAAVELQIAASLQMLEHELVTGVEPHLRSRAPGALHGEELSAAVSSYIAEGTRRWHDEALDLAADRLRRTAQQSDELLDEVDWQLVDTLLPPAMAGRYPAAILERFAAPPAIGPAGSAPLDGPAAPGRTGPAWPAIVRRAAYGAAGATAGLAVFGPAALVPSIAAGALGATVGTVAEMRVGDSRARTAAGAWARATVAATMGELARAVRLRLRESTAPIRQGVGAAFAELDTALARVSERPITGSSSDAGSDARLVATLRADLSSESPAEHS